MRKQIMAVLIAAITIIAASMPSFANTGISVEQAKQIALQNAGLRASDVVFTKACLDRDDGRMEYDIDFRAGMKEYNYDIDASTGTIVKCDLDYESPYDDCDDLYDFDD